MMAFTKLEIAALQAIFLETPELAPGLQRQLEEAVVVKREISDGGFFTTIAVADDAPAINCPSVLGYATHARLACLEHGINFVLFIDDGRLQMLEGFTWGPESTFDLDLADLQFEIYNQPVRRFE